MKREAFIALLLFGFATYAHEGHHHGAHTQEQKVSEASPSIDAVYAQIQGDYLRSIKPIFDQKCAACHSRDVAAPWYASVPLVGHLVESDRSEAKEHLEIAKGFPFAGHGTPKEDLDAIKESVEKDAMPTTLYRLMHPSSRLTKSEKESILEWVKVSQEKISAEPAEKPTEQK